MPRCGAGRSWMLSVKCILLCMRSVISNVDGNNIALGGWMVRTFLKGYIGFSGERSGASLTLFFGQTLAVQVTLSFTGRICALFNYNRYWGINIAFGYRRPVVTTLYAALELQYNQQSPLKLHQQTHRTFYSPWIPIIERQPSKRPLRRLPAHSPCHMGASKECRPTNALTAAVRGQEDLVLTYRHWGHLVLMHEAEINLTFRCAFSVYGK